MQKGRLHQSTGIDLFGKRDNQLGGWFVRVCLVVLWLFLGLFVVDNIMDSSDLIRLVSFLTNRSCGPVV